MRRLRRLIFRSTCSSASQRTFRARIRIGIWGLSLSRLISEALQYKRLAHHFRAERDEYILVTIPAHSEIFFAWHGTHRARTTHILAFSMISVTSRALNLN
jgi:hypothetical protein